MSIKPKISLLILLCSYASGVQAGGTRGGGEGLEIKFMALRQRVSDFVNSDSVNLLTFPSEMNADRYRKTMNAVLKNPSLKVAFTAKKVRVRGVLKTCRSSFDPNDAPQILCNASRFESAGETEKLKLVHHEIAILAGVEVNSGAHSDYFISEQLAGAEYVTQPIYNRRGIGLFSGMSGSEDDEKTRKELERVALKAFARFSRDDAPIRVTAFTGALEEVSGNTKYKYRYLLTVSQSDSSGIAEIFMSDESGSEAIGSIYWLKSNTKNH